jgi:AcrR family transcriptional regulator
MPTRQLTQPRKLPRQDRSRETVDALLEATAQVLVADGYDRASTNKIALKAGVSIGSLYQYFPNKESLVAALIERHYQDMAAICRQSIGEDVHQVSLQRLIRDTVQAMVAIHAVNPKLHALLQEQVPKVGKLKHLMELHLETREMVRKQLEMRRDEIRVQDLSIAAFVVVETVDSLIHATLLQEDPMHWTPEKIVEEIADLLLAYLRKIDLTK